MRLKEGEFPPIFYALCNDLIPKSPKDMMIASWKIESVTVSRDFLRILATLTKGLMKTQKTKHVHDSTIYNFYDTLLKKSLISICSVIRMEFDASEKGYE